MLIMGRLKTGEAEENKVNERMRGKREREKKKEMGEEKEITHEEVKKTRE